MKNFTDIEQSKQLAKFLPLDSSAAFVPCWSLVALLEILPYPHLSKDKLGSGKEGWMVSVYPNDCRYDSRWYDNPVDACVDMIEELHEQNLL